MHVFWKIWVNAKTEEKALRSYKRFIERMVKTAFDETIKPYPKIAGFVVSFNTHLENAQWNDAVIETISLAQRVGYSWQLSGSIYDDPSGWSNKASISGIESIEWILVKDKSDSTG